MSKTFYWSDISLAFLLGSTLVFLPNNPICGQSLLTLKPTLLVNNEDDFEGVRITRDGRFSVGIAGNEIKVWENENLKEIFSNAMETYEEKRVALASIDGSCLLAKLVCNPIQDTPPIIEVRNVSSNKVISRINIATSSEALELNFNGDATQLSACDADHDDDDLVQVFEVASGKKLCSFRPFDDNINATCFVPQKNWIACGGMDKSGVTLKIFDCTSGGEVGSSRWQKEPVVSLAASTDGSIIASAAGNSIKLFNISGGDFRTIGSFETSNYQQSNSVLAFGKNNSRLWNANISQLNCWDVDSREIIAQEELDFKSCDIPNNDSQVLFSMDDARVVNLLFTEPLVTTKIKPVWKKKVHKDLNRTNYCNISTSQRVTLGDSAAGPFYTVDLADGGRLAVTPELADYGSSVNRNSVLYKSASQIRRLDLGTHQDDPIAIIEEQDEISQSQESSDGRLVLVLRANEVRSLKIVDNENRLAIEKILDPILDGDIKVSTDNKFASFSNSSTCKIYDLEKDLEITQIEATVVLGFSPDVTKLICDNGATVFDLGSGAISRPFPTLRAKFARLSEEQPIVISVTDQKICIWDYNQGFLIKTLDPEIKQDLENIAITPDAKWLVTGFENGEVAAWDLSQWIPNDSDETAARSSRRMELWHEKSKTFASSDGVTITITTDGQVKTADVEQALRDTLKKVRQ